MALACSACVADAPYLDALASAGGVSAQLAQSVSASQALASLPSEAGHVVAVIERRTEDIVAQEIVLKEEPPFTGENKIAVAIGRLRGRRSGAFAELVPPPSSDIAAEMGEGAARHADANFPADMAQNGYGPFGYAAGKANGKSCVYAWQFVPGRGGFSAGSENSPFWTRVRLCRQRATTAALVETVSGLRISAAMPAAAPGRVAFGSSDDALSVAQAMH